MQPNVLVSVLDERLGGGRENMKESWEGSMNEVGVVFAELQSTAAVQFVGVRSMNTTEMNKMNACAMLAAVM